MLPLPAYADCGSLAFRSLNSFSKSSVLRWVLMAISACAPPPSCVAHPDPQAPFADVEHREHAQHQQHAAEVDHGLARRARHLQHRGLDLDEFVELQVDRRAVEEAVRQRIGGQLQEAARGLRRPATGARPSFSRAACHSSHRVPLRIFMKMSAAFSCSAAGILSRKLRHRDEAARRRRRRRTCPGVLRADSRSWSRQRAARLRRRHRAAA